MAALAGGSAAILLGLIGLAVPSVAVVGAAIGLLVGTVLNAWGGIKILMNAFEENALTGILYLLFGPYQIYFTFSRWEVNRRPFFIALLGTLVMFVSLIPVMIASSRT